MTVHIRELQRDDLEPLLDLRSMVAAEGARNGEQWDALIMGLVLED